MDNLNEIRKELDNYVKAKRKLTQLGVLRSERTIGEYGEWFAEKLTGGVRNIKTSSKGYDLTKGTLRIQVKSHAKGDTNNARWTDWTYENKDFDELILLIFNKELVLKEAYSMTYEQACERINQNLKNKVLKWDDYQDYQISKFPSKLNSFISDELKSKQ